MEWTGRPITACLGALTGHSPASFEPLERLAPLAKALQGDAAAMATLASSAPAADRLEALLAHGGAVSSLLRAYMDEHGNRIVTGFDIGDRRLWELPEVVLNAVSAEVAHPASRPAAAEDDLRDLVPEEARASYDALLEEARGVYGLRDDEVGVGWQWRKGLTRRALLEAGQRLAGDGALHAPEHIFEASPDEAVAMLRGETPGADAMRARANDREALQALDPPLTIGPEETPPPDDYFPPAVARMRKAVMCYIANFDSDAAPIAGRSGELRGHPVSAGSYEGRARVVRGPADFGRIERGDVLIARTTSPSYNVLLPMLGAVVTDRGGALCHAAIVAREYGIPGVVGCGGATSTIPDGSIVRVDGDTGMIEIVGQSKIEGDAAAQAADDTVRDAQVRAGGRCVPLREALDEAAYGGKSTSLGASLRNDLPVPDGVAVDVALAESVAAGDPKSIETLRKALDALPGPYAVRSSAVGEDSSSASFAGQHLTVLGVEDADGVCAAIARVWASGRSEAALSYRRRMGIEGEPEVAVTVQQLVDPVCAGVLFTRDPVSGGDTCIVESTWGLGESVVAGLVTPDHFRIAQDGTIEERRAGEKDLAIRRSANGGTQEEEVAADDVHRLTLDDTQLSELFALAKRCEQVFDGAQDIEWAFAGGQLHLLQSRAITTR